MTDHTTNTVDGAPMPPTEDLMHQLQDPLRQTPLLKRAVAEIERLRLERDVLALNRGPGSPVIILFDNAGEVVGVTWKVAETASDEEVRLPAYAAEEATA